MPWTTTARCTATGTASHPSRRRKPTTWRCSPPARRSATPSWARSRRPPTPVGGALLVAAPLVDLRSVLATVLVPLAAGGRAMLCRHLDRLDPGRLADRVAQEGLSAVVPARGDTPEGERTVTGVLPEWNGQGPGMA